MTRYLLVRLGQIVLTLAGIMSVLFLLLHASGNPAAVIAGPGATEDIVQATAARLGLDRPLVVQYGIYLRGLAQFDLGDSFTAQQPALDVVLDVLPASLAIVLPAVALASLGGIAIGALAATSRRRRLSRAVMVLSFVGHSVPFFWLGILLVLLFALTLDLVPPVGSGGLRFVVLPVAAMAISHLASIARLTFGEVMEASRRPFVVTAVSKGLRQPTVLLRHVVPNALPPVISWIGVVFAFAMGQLLIIEPLFAYRGIGAAMVQAVQGQDFPIVEAGVLVVSVLVMAGNLVADLLNRALDPSLRRAAP